MKPLVKPQSCKDIQDIRDAIDVIDMEVLRLFALRQDYVKEIVKFKSSDEEAIIARERRELVLKQRKEWAEENGIDGDLMKEVFRMLIERNIEIQIEINKSNNK